MQLFLSRNIILYTRYKTLLLVLALTCLFNTRLFSNTNNILINDYSYQNGLKTSMANYAYKDSKGFLWLCTMDGVFRFDGYSFRNINTIVKDTFNIEAQCIIEDDQGNLWIGTLGRGLYLYNPRNERLFPVKLSTGNDANVFRILFFNNKVWVASNIGLLVFDNKPVNVNTTLKVNLLRPDSVYIEAQANSINVLLPSHHDSSIWVGSNGALLKLNTHTLNFNMVNTHPQNSIRCLSDYSPQKIIAGSWDGGVFTVNTSTNQIQNDVFIQRVNDILGDARVIDVQKDKHDRLWVATFGAGLFVFDKNERETLDYTRFKNDKSRHSLRSDLINRMFIDSTDIIWLCMDQPALSKLYFQDNSLTSYRLGEEHTNNEIFSFNPSLDDEKLWITTVNSGIYLFNNENHTTRHFTSNENSELKLVNNKIAHCFQDSEGNLWLADRRTGLYIVPAKEAIPLTLGQQKQVIHPIDANELLSPNFDGQYITKFYEDSKGRIWIGTWGALYLVNIEKSLSNARNITDIVTSCKVSHLYGQHNALQDNLPKVPAISILEINKNEYWIGTSDVGIIRLTENDANTFSGELSPLNEQLPGTVINSLIVGKNEGVWIGTNAGLCYYNHEDESVKTFTENDGLASENINNIVVDKNLRIWVSTAYGISSLDPNTQAIQNYFQRGADQLNLYIPNAGAITSEGIIYFSSNEAIVALDPANMVKSQPQNPIYFTDIKIDNNKIIPNEKYKGTRVIDSNINSSETVNVPYNHTLSLEFAAIDFISPNQQLYKYRMGNNKEWVILNPNQRSLILPAMSTGEYTLEIMLANPVNNETRRSIRINYLPPFWQSKIAFVLYFVTLFLLFMIYRRLTLQKMHKDAIIEQERYERKKLEELDAMKSEFFSNISHEFRTPLSLIISPLEKFLAEKSVEERRKEKINLALKSSYRLLQLTNELMDFSKLEKQQMKPIFAVCDVVHLIDEISSHYHDLAESNNIEFKQNCPFDSLVIPIDRRMIEKVIFNLLSNAFKYTPENGVVMINMAKDTSQGDENVKISVINTGEGIPKEVIDRIFDKYYQVNNVQNQKYEGTGIGLALVKSYIELHHGQVTVSSEPDKETCFDVYLPVYQDEFVERTDEEQTYINKIEKQIHQESGEANSGSKPSSHYTLLLVEDDDDIREYIAEELSDSFKVITAKNGKEGLKKAEEIIPDLIITDVVMPVLSGTELCRIVKSQVSTSHIPIILLSANAAMPQQIEGLESGADVYIPKPFNAGYLKAQIIRLLSFKETVYLRYLKENTLIPEESLNSKIDKSFMEKVIAFIEKNISDPNLNVEQLANHVALSHAQTYRKVRAISGMSVVKFIRTVRLKKAAQLVADNTLNYTEIAYETGFSSLSYFTRCFHDHFGKSPSDFAAGIKEQSDT